MGFCIGVHPLGLMPNAAGTAPAPLSVPKKTAARVALFDMPATSSSLLAECFRQFLIECVLVPGEQAQRLQREKFDACVIPLVPAAGSIIELARSSPSNSRIVIYGLGGSAQDAMRFSKYCINAVFHEPLERSAVLKLVRSTRPLVVHEFRRYVRIPVMTEVSIVAANGARLTLTSQEISSGGMSLKGTHTIEPGTLVEVSFSLLTLPRIWLKGYVSWKKPNKTLGIRFESSDERRHRLKGWIDAYLES